MPKQTKPSPPDSHTKTTGHLSIGEVLALLLEEFPDVTISKIRFLESQGLIDPERTSSGYRKFYANDVDLLHCILREQRENYLPLRVIKDRLEAGEIDPTNENPRPRGIKNVSDEPTIPQPDRHPSAGSRREHPAYGPTTDNPNDSSPLGAAALFMRTESDAFEDGSSDANESPSNGSTSEPKPVPNSTSTSPSLSAADKLHTAAELCASSELTSEQLSDLESYGVLSAESLGGGKRYDDNALEIAELSKQFLDAGIDARHLRGWRVAADREVGLLEQLIQPLLRQRNPEAHVRAIAQLTDLERAGGKLRTAMMQSALRHHTTN
jgi:DNA-binding transcriptional MerR regulator